MGKVLAAWLWQIIGAVGPDKFHRLQWMAALVKRKGGGRRRAVGAGYGENFSKALYKSAGGH